MRRAHTRRSGRIDGLKVRIVDNPAAPAADLGHALRLLARMMIRAHQADGDHGAIESADRSSSPLTPAAVPRTDHVDDAA